MERCEFLHICGFYLRFGQRRSNIWKGLVSFYCHGGGAERCERRQCFITGGVFPNDGIMPSGDEIPKVFLALE